MLSSVRIKDFAIIKDASIDFLPGFTVITGETGAGKTILISAILFLIGGKTDTTYIRYGAKEASVTAIFDLPTKESIGEKEGKDKEKESKEIKDWFTKSGISKEESSIIIRRVLKDSGKTLTYINGDAVTKTQLLTLTSLLINIHGQHAHEALLDKEAHRMLLDSKVNSSDILNDYVKVYKRLQEECVRLKEFDLKIKEVEEKKERFSYEIQEIKEAKIKEKEDEEADAELTKLSGYEKLFNKVSEAQKSLEGGEAGAVFNLKEAMKNIEEAASIDKELSTISKRVTDAFYEVEDIAREVSSYFSSLSFNPARIKEVEDRLSLLYSLKKKYAKNVRSPIKEVIDYCNKAEEELKSLEDKFSNKTDLEKKIEEDTSTLLTLGSTLHSLREEEGIKLAEEVTSTLKTLGMKNSKFLVNVAINKEESIKSLEDKVARQDSALEKAKVLLECATSNGLDDIEFLLKSNTGSQFLPLIKVASGGELSRVMLAIKSTFIGERSVDTLIFDEVDTGIGGEVAIEVGKHIKKLSTGSQVLCITHLASIASIADNQLLIKKSVEGEETTSRAEYVEKEARVKEIARMLSGNKDKVEALEHARMLLNQLD